MGAEQPRSLPLLLLVNETARLEPLKDLPPEAEIVATATSLDKLPGGPCMGCSACIGMQEFGARTPMTEVAAPSLIAGARQGPLPLTFLHCEQLKEASCLALRASLWHP